MQLQPFLDAYGFENVLPMFFPRLVNHSQAELERIGRFLIIDGPSVGHSLKPQNVGRERLRPSPLRQALVQAPVLERARRRIVPRHWSQSLKEHWRAQIDPPADTRLPDRSPPRHLRRRPGPARFVAGDQSRLRELPGSDGQSILTIGPASA